MIQNNYFSSYDIACVAWVLAVIWGVAWITFITLITFLR